MEKIRELIQDIDVAMLTTVSDGGLLRSRPMATVLDGDHASIWLFTDEDSAVANEVRAEPRVGLTFTDPSHDRYISICGMADLDHDHERMRLLWRPEFAKWFPNGPDDPSLVLLHVRIGEIEVWDDSAKLMRDFFAAPGAQDAGNPSLLIGEHARVRPQ